MIINQDIKPEKQAYYLGSKVLAALRDTSTGPISPSELFIKINQSEKVSYHAFSMALNWLFLLGVLDHKEGEIIKCF
jgi:hypothetical protein